MVTDRHSRRRRTQRGAVILELVVAMGILTSVLLPVAFSMVQEQRLARIYYHRAIAMEIVDGEVEVLMAGEWRSYPKGQHPYTVRAEAARNLPPGRFLLSIEEQRVQLQWRPQKTAQGGVVSREFKIKTQS